MIEWLEHHLIPCFFKSTFGVECPGCGMQRAFISLLRGNFTESICYQPALIPLILTFLTLLIHLKIKHPKGASVLLVMFIITSSVMVIQFIIKQYLLLKAQ